MKPDSWYSELQHLPNYSWRIIEEKAIASAIRDYWAKINATHLNQVNFMVIIISTSSEKSFVSKWCLSQLRWAWTGCLNIQKKPYRPLNVRHPMNYEEEHGLRSQEIIPLLQSNSTAHVCMECNYSEEKWTRKLVYLYSLLIISNNFMVH